MSGTHTGGSAGPVGGGAVGGGPVGGGPTEGGQVGGGSNSGGSTGRRPVGLGPAGAGIGSGAGTGAGSGAGAWRAFRSAGAACALAWRSGRTTLLLSLLCGLVAGLLPAATALLVSRLFDALTGAADGPTTGTCVLLVAASLGMALFPALGEYTRARSSRAIRLRVQEELFDAVNRLPGLRPFEDPRFQDRLRLAQQAGGVAPDILVGAAFGSLQALLTVGGFLVTVFVVNPLLGVLTLVLTLPLVRAQLAAGRRRAAVLSETMSRNRRQSFYSSLVSDVDAVKEIRLFGLQDFLRGRARHELRAVSGAEERTDRQNLARRLPASLLGVAVYALGLLWAVRAARHGELSLGQVSVCLAAVAGIQTGVGQLAAGGASAYQAALTFDHYRTLGEAPPDLAPATDPRPPAALRGTIEFQDVWFRYHPDAPWILRGVSVTLRADTVTALVGLNGAGKSTLVKLLCRLYDPDRGRVLWDGVDIREFPPDEYRQRIGVVFQDYCRYDLTAGENIGLGRLAHLDDQARIADAARAAGIHDRVRRLDGGYGALLSRIFLPEGVTEAGWGHSLSGGEWQRLAVARAFMRGDADLMILDEPSAGLDAAAEQELHENLRELRRGATSLVISHRLSTVRDADRIVVLGAGQVIEDGTHDALMALGGRYAELFTLQASGYQDAVVSIRAGGV
ncbi:multidrug ABC transporter permease [Kitasatospora xanthocidica]|uniref:ABC transporter ATP-binding protein n=1 Tax=Kitasatospora xanthocidica TaxID=83382 RepID=UPI00167A567E|nr:ABC transporter ATP-binding protein [Kitasatospora xanthocidica]GHF35736.1 multidrug ABC transporter permease [Kitasatospora xanthocidica]